MRGCRQLRNSTSSPGARPTDGGIVLQFRSCSVDFYLSRKYHRFGSTFSVILTRSLRDSAGQPSFNQRPIRGCSQEHGVGEALPLTGA